MQIREVVEDLHNFREFRPRKERVIMLHVLTYPNRLGLLPTLILLDGLVYLQIKLSGNIVS